MNYYDHIAEGYEELHREEQLAKMELIRNWCATHRPIHPSDLLLDVACGTGLTSDFPCTVMGIDPAMQLLKRGALPKVKVRSEAEHLPFANGSFDIISSVTALQNFHDPVLALREMQRVGKAECLFILSFLKKAKRAEEFDRLLRHQFAVRDYLVEDKDFFYFLNR